MVNKKTFVFVLWSILGLVSPVLCHAQIPSELPCAAGASDLLSPTYNGNTQKTRSWVCVDALGFVTSPVFMIAGSTNFSTLSSGTNVTAAMLVGTGASLAPTGTGTISANRINGTAVPATATVLGSNGSGVLVDNTALIAPVASPTFTGTITFPGNSSISATVINFLNTGFDGLQIGNGGAGTVQLTNASGDGMTVTAGHTTTICGNSGATCLTAQVSGLSFNTGITVTGSVSNFNNAGLTSKTFGTATNCSSSAAPAVCGSAAAGSVVIAAAGTTVTVNTTAVTANSQITLAADDTLGTKLLVTCNSTLATLIGGLAITARTNGTSFQITSGATPAVNPLCLSYKIVN